jgi:hypothetical protein
MDPIPPDGSPDLLTLCKDEDNVDPDVWIDYANKFPAKTARRLQACMTLGDLAVCKEAHSVSLPVMCAYLAYLSLGTAGLLQTRCGNTFIPLVPEGDVEVGQFFAKHPEVHEKEPLERTRFALENYFFPASCAGSWSGDGVA